MPNKVYYSCLILMIVIMSIIVHRTAGSDVVTWYLFIIPVTGLSILATKYSD